MKLPLTSVAAALVLAVTLPAAAPSLAATPGETLSQCLMQKTNEADRTVLVRWIFAVISRHPGVSDMGKVSEADYQSASSKAGALFTRLMAEDCRTETAAAMKSGDSNSVGTGFQALGQTAGGDLMSHPAVQASMGDLLKYVDLNKIAQVMYGN